MTFNIFSDSNVPIGSIYKVWRGFFAQAMHTDSFVADFPINLSWQKK